MLESVKQALRITTDGFNTELESLISACKQELSANKVDINNDNFSEMLKLTIINFVKIHFGNNENSEKYSIIYESLKGYLMATNPKKEE